MPATWGWGVQPWGEDWGSSRTFFKKTGLTRTGFLKLINNYKIKALVYPSYSRKDETYDDYEENRVHYNLNPLTITCYARELSANSLIFRQYGLSNTGSLEILIDKHYLQWLLICNKIEINGNEYEVFRSATGQYNSIREGAFNLVSIVLYRKSGDNATIPIIDKSSRNSKELVFEFKRMVGKYGKKVLVYPAQRTKDETYDDQEYNYSSSYLNPTSIKAYVISLGTLSKVLTAYGLRDLESKQLLTSYKNLDLLKEAGKIKIDNINYEVFRESVGNKMLVQQVPGGIVRVILERA